MKTPLHAPLPSRRAPAAEPPTAAAKHGAAAALAASPRGLAQRQRIEAGFGPALQRLPVDEALTAQRQTPDEEMPRQARTDAGAAPQDGGRPGGLPPALRSGIEGLSGLDLGDVQVHRDSPRPAEVGALAYAQGADIHLGPGQERHLPHEAWHVVQQRQGRVQPTLQLAGVAINDDAGLEAEADAMGARALG